jgi:hypothetical protein
VRLTVAAAAPPGVVSSRNLLFSAGWRLVAVAALG